MWETADNILCVRLDSVGDVIMTSPAFRALKASKPERKLTLLTSRSGAAIASLIPEIDETIVFDAPWMKATEPRLDSRIDFEIIQELREIKFDAAIIFTVFSQNPLPAAYLCYAADIPIRIGYCRENPYQLFTHWAKEIDTEAQMRHEVRRQLDLVASVGCRTDNERLSLTVPEIATKGVGRLLAGLTDFNPYKPWALIHAGATAESRRYPHYAKVANILTRELHWQVVFTGTEGERSLVESIRSEVEAPTLSLVGRLTLGELAALIKMAPVLITNNTGPTHVAAALGTPVVVLYALTNPQHTPWKGKCTILFHDVPCRNCFKSVCPVEHHDCLQQVEPEMVVAAAIGLVD